MINHEAFLQENHLNHGPSSVKTQLLSWESCIYFPLHCSKNIFVNLRNCSFQLYYVYLDSKPYMKILFHRFMVHSMVDYHEHLPDKTSPEQSTHQVQHGKWTKILFSSSRCLFEFNYFLDDDCKYFHPKPAGFLSNYFLQLEADIEIYFYYSY